MEGGTTDFAEHLAFGAVIPVKEWHGSVTTRTGAVLRDVTVRPPYDGINHLVVAELIVFQEPLVFNGFVTDDLGKDIGFKLLVFRGVRIIKSPLLQRNVFSDKK